MVLILAGLAWILPGVRGSATGAETPPPRRVPVAVSRPELVDHYLLQQQYTGLARARRASRVAFEQGGLVLEIGVDEGQRVTRNQVLARIDVTLLRRQQDELRAERSVAAAVLAELESGPRKEVIAAARSSLASLEADLALARARAGRVRRLVDNDTTSDEEWDAARFSVQALEARLAASRAALDELERGTRKEKLAAQRARLQGVDARLATIEERIRDGELRAPYDATITARHVDEGAVVAAGDAVFSLVDVQPREARIGVPGEIAAELEPGQVAEVEVDGRRIAARIEGLPPTTDPATRTRPVILVLEPEDGPAPAPGAVVRWTLDRRITTAGFWVDAGALRRSVRGLWSCYVVSIGAAADAPDHLVEERAIEVLHTDGSRVLVRGTLQASDRVIRDGAHRVVAGQRVRVLD